MSVPLDDKIKAKIIKAYISACKNSKTGSVGEWVFLGQFGVALGAIVFRHIPTRLFR